MFFVQKIPERRIKPSFIYVPNQNVGFLLFGVFMLYGSTALAEVIDIFPTGTGWQIQRANGEILGNVTSQQAAQRAADIYTRRGNTINWRSATPATTSSSAVTTTGTATGKLATTGTSAGTVPGARQLTSGTNTGGVRQGQLTSGNSTTPRQLTSGSGSNLPATTGGGSGGNTGGGKVTSKGAGSAVGKALGTLGGVLMVVDGAKNLSESIAGTEKATWKDVGRGALGGAETAGGATMIANAYVGVGTVVWIASTAAGAVIGAAGAGAEMFSETDCEMDPVLGKYACCNISNLSNIDAYRAEIGDRMFTDTFPYVRYCVQGKKEFKEEQPWLKGRFLDDHWSANAEIGLCPGYDMPVNPNMNITLIAVEDADDFGHCWAWECADPGRVRSGGTCVGSDVDDASMMGPVLPDGFERVTPNTVGADCAADDLPQYATAGTYIDNGVDVVCAATACQSGTYLVMNSAGVSQGWCVASTYCTDTNTHLNIIDGTKTDLQCVANNTNVETQINNDETQVNDEEQLPGNNSDDNTDTRNECERGVTGYIIFEDVCMPTAQMQQILSQRAAQSAQQLAKQQAAAEIANLQSQIDRYAGKIQDIEDAHADDKVSVWKNEEGKFNTSRLLSDSIAGVALGTVGGLVVNKVVKDKHVETGFEELGCAIDGVKIADFDDDFFISGAVDKEDCLANNMGHGNVYVWASRFSNGTDYARMIEDVSNPDNNTCWVRVDIKSDNPKISVSDVAPRWFVVGQQVTCGDWTNRDTLRQRALNARKSARTWATVGGAVGGAGLGVGIMELFGNRLIGGKVMGQKSLDEMELLYSQMSETERREYTESMEKLSDLCDELYQKGGTSPWCK